MYEAIYEIKVLLNYKFKKKCKPFQSNYNGLHKYKLFRELYRYFKILN